MAGTAQAADRIRCDRCTGHYVVDAASDGSPRVRCNKCGHVREAAEPPSPASIPGKWTVIGPDGKAMSFDTWEELTESRRPSAITPTAKGMEEANHALKDLKPAAQHEKKSASALLDITPAPKLALADMDSAIDLGEPLGGSRKSRPGATTMSMGSMGSSGAPSSTGKLEPLLVRSFSQPPKTQSSPSKVEWAPKLDKGPAPLRADDNTMRVEIAPSQLAEARPSNYDRAAQAVQIAPAPATTRVIDAERPTAPTGGVVAADDSIDELDPDSLLEDSDDEEAAPLSLRDAIADDDELGDDDLQEEPDPHELLSIRDLVVAEPHDNKVEAKPPTLSSPPTRPSQLPPKPTLSSPPPKLFSQPPPPKVSQAPGKLTSHAPPKATQASPQIEAKVVVTPSTPPKPNTSQPPRPKSLSRPDAPANHSRAPSIRPDVVSVSDPPLEEETTKRTRIKKQPEPNRTWMYVALAAVLIAGVGWRLMQSPEQPTPPPPKPTPTVATVVPPTPVTAPTTTDTAPTPTMTASDTVAVDTPPTTPTGATTNITPPTTPTGATNVTTPPTTPAEKKPVAENTSGGTAPSATPAEKKPSVPVGDAPGSMSELLDKAGSAKRKGDLATARELYGRVIAMSPSNVEANGGLGDVAKAQGDLGAAKASYERALAASPTYSPALLGLADVEWDQGNQASAKKRYAQIVDRLGDRAPARAKERAQ